MAKATAQEVKVITLTMNEDEAQKVLALLGKVASDGDTDSTYSVLSDALGYPYTSVYKVTNSYNDEISTVYLHKK